MPWTTHSELDEVKKFRVSWKSVEQRHIIIEAVDAEEAVTKVERGHYDANHVSISDSEMSEFETEEWDGSMFEEDDDV